MSYRSETIATTVRKLNDSYFLPAIQREFVWKPHQIVQLFDSLMRNYPIGSFLFWELVPDNRAKWQAYKFLDRGSDAGIHNEIANTSGASALNLILDGQQRLTALNIGLRGYYKVKKKYGRWDNPESWSNRKLFLNLLHDPAGGEAEDGDGVYYEFDFFEQVPKQKDGAYWFEIGQVLSYESDVAFDQFREDLVDRLPEDATRGQMRVVRTTLDRLYRAIHKEDFIAYYLETEQDYDRVLDIFVRANAGGTKLSKSDLLMSTVTASWGDIDARQEIHSFVDDLNNGLTRRNDFDKDFVMKSCLVLTDLPVKYQVQNFNHQNLMRIRDKWTEIKRSLRAAVEFVNRHGIDRDTLTSANALIPIAYFLSTHPDVDLHGSRIVDVENAKSIRRWLLGTLLTGSFSAATDTTLGEARKVLQLTHEDEHAIFPSTEINEALRRAGRSSRPEDVLDAVLELSYGKRSSVLALSLLYPEQPWGTIPHHVDHVFSRAIIREAADQEIGDWTWTIKRDRIENLCLLSESENEEKGGREFCEWMATRDSTFLQRHLIPANPDLWRVENFVEFLEARRNLLKNRMAEVIGVEEERIIAEMESERAAH